MVHGKDVMMRKSLQADAMFVKGGSRISGYEVQMCKGGGHFTDFISFFLNIP